MIDIKKNFSLYNFNSLQLDHCADYFCEVFNEQDCIEALEFAKEKQLQKQQKKMKPTRGGGGGFGAK